MVLIIGGFVCGLLAGIAARYGRLCSMSAVEDAVIGGSWRGMKAWGLALSIAIILTQLAAWLDLFHPPSSMYATASLDWPSALMGGIVFGFGMALTGTCSFGLLVRLGGGDLRALISSLFVGIAAFAFSSGILSPLRQTITGLSTISLGSPNEALLPGLIEANFGKTAALFICGYIVFFLLSSAFSDGRLLRRPRLMVSGVILGAAIAGGWAVTGYSYFNMDTARIESLSFVAPTGKILLEVMSPRLQDAAFGIVSVLGVICGSLVVSAARQEIQWEAFDDAREMRRHLVGAVLMGVGGVLAKGCTIGQGLTAGSVLSVLVPLTLIGIFIGAKLGLAVLLLEPSLVFSRSK